MLASEPDVTEFWKTYIQDLRERERYEVDVCYADGTPVKKLNHETGLVDEVAKGVSTVDRKEKFVGDVRVQRVKYEDGMTLEML